MDPRDNKAGSWEARNLQGELYVLPYHWLPEELPGGGWAIGRFIDWGHKYLAVLHVVAALVARLGPQRVLDFGCGDGRLTHELLQRGVPYVVGVDVVAEALLFAEAFNVKFKERAFFICGGANDVQGYFDVAVMMEVLEHVPDGEVASVVRQLWRQLEPEGQLVVSVPTRNVPLNPKHERHYTRDVLSRELSPHFEVSETFYVHRLGWKAEMIRRIMANRIWVLRQPYMIRKLTDWYRAGVMDADASSGAHLVALCRRSEKA